MKKSQGLKTLIFSCLIFAIVNCSYHEPPPDPDNGGDHPRDECPNTEIAGCIWKDFLCDCQECNDYSEITTGGFLDICTCVWEYSARIQTKQYGFYDLYTYTFMDIDESLYLPANNYFTCD
jgi:hypothetical protein